MQIPYFREDHFKGGRSLPIQNFTSVAYTYTWNSKIATVEDINGKLRDVPGFPFGAVTLVRSGRPANIGLPVLL